jgi:O-6-methylguanine DNA methyltransferase
LLKGTPFQRRVWRARLEIPRGTTVTYGELARRLKNPRASRAVGQAVGANPLAVLVPCHRVLAANGALGGFAWGPEMKRALLAGEGVAA